MKVDLIIFDCDGVLVDSEIIAHRTGAKEMTRLGFPLTVEKSIELFSGVANEAIPTIIQKAYHRTISSRDLEKVLKKIEQALQKNLQSIAHIERVMDYLDQQQMRKCIASNSAYDYIVASLAITGLQNYFKSHHIYSAAFVKQAKPKPDLFLHAAKQQNVKPNHCLVIEDSPVGIEAAHAAGMPVIGFLGASHAQQALYREKIMQHHPDAIAQDALELLTLLSSLPR